MAATEQLKELVSRMPDPDGRGMYTTDIDKDKIETAIAAIHKGGSSNVLGLIDMLAEPGSEQDVKPRYALHCLANYVLIQKDEAGRLNLCEALASQLDSDRPLYVREFLCQELGWAGRGEAISALGKLLTNEQLCSSAAVALTAIRVGAAVELRAAWPKAAGTSRRHIMDALSALAEPATAKTFESAVHDKDREVRIAALAGLASLGQARSLETLLKAADAAQGWERIQATGNCLVLAENLLAAGDKTGAKRIYEQLKKTRTDDSEKHIRQAAEKSLAAIV